MNNEKIDKTPTFISLVPLEQFYSKENGEVFWHYRLNNGQWNKQIAPYQQLPWIDWKRNENI